MPQLSKAQKAALRGVTGLHRWAYRRTGGRIGGTMRRGGSDPAQVLLLTTIGARSGRPRTNPLVYMDVGGQDLLIVASNGGMDRHPAWYLNLRARPKATVQIGGTVRRMRARFADGDERGPLWGELVRRFPQYARYQSKTEREIPLVLLASDDG